MKKIYMLMISALMLAFMSCSSDNDEVEISHQVNITVDPSTVDSAFHGYSVNDTVYGKNMDQDAQLMIASLIYDQNGNLVERKDCFVEDYYSESRFSLKMDQEQEYTVIAITYSVFKDDKSKGSYRIENEGNLEKLSIVPSKLNGNSYYSNWSMLGLASKKITASNKDNVIYVKPASAIIVLFFNNIHTFDEQGVDSHFIAYQNNEKVSFANGEFVYETSSANNLGNAFRLDVTENPSSRRIFIMLNILPTHNMDMWAGLTIGENSIHYSTLLKETDQDPSKGKATISIEAGKEYRVDINCDICTMVVQQLSRSTISCKSIYQKSEGSSINDSMISCVAGSPQSANVMELISKMK